MWGFRHIDAKGLCFGGSPFGSSVPNHQSESAFAPPPPFAARRGSGATSFTRLAEPKLGEAERRMVDLTRIELVTS